MRFLSLSSVSAYGRITIHLISRHQCRQSTKLLWGKTCKECHDLGFAAAHNTPEVPKANLTTRWLKHGNFDHPAHQMVVCSSCHQQASTSKLTSDVLLPGIKACQTCHHSGEEAARSNCSECHQYHDWNKEEYVEPKLTATVHIP
jgi:RecJ-like exonuclease